jgi:predicted dehydrogenase
MAHDQLSRRHFFYGTLLAGAIPAGGFGSSPSLKLLGYKSPNEKLNIAYIGAGGRAVENIRGCVSENIVALADPDSSRAAETFKKYDKTPKYKDFRQMLDKEARNIDAVIISTPDHMHATAAMWSMERGKHVYVEKPLTRTVWEARQLTLAAAKYKVATQMGNQGYSLEGERVAAEIIWSGEIGDVTEVHAWTDRAGTLWPQGLTAAPTEDKVPETLDWNTWLGIAKQRPYSQAYVPYSWRGFWDFGCGALGDMACHLLGSTNMALQLTAPTSLEVIKQEGKNPYSFPKSSVTRFDFPARRSMPALKLFWYDSVTDPPMRPQGLSENEILLGVGLPMPPTAVAASTVPGGAAAGPGAGAPAAGQAGAPMRRASQTNGCMFLGEKGVLTTDLYGGNVRLLPAARMKGYRLPPQLLTRSPGHHRDWIRACKGGDPACSNFNVSGPFAEWIALGVVALHFEGKLEWDSAKMKVTNIPEANRYLKPQFFNGWKFS